MKVDLTLLKWVLVPDITKTLRIYTKLFWFLITVATTNWNHIFRANEKNNNWKQEKKNLFVIDPKVLHFIQHIYFLSKKKNCLIFFAQHFPSSTVNKVHVNIFPTLNIHVIILRIVIYAIVYHHVPYTKHLYKMHENKGVKNNFLNLNLITYIKPNVQIYFSTYLLQ